MTPNDPKNIDEQRQLADYRTALARDLADALMEYEQAERDFDYLGMAKAQARINAAKKTLNIDDDTP